MNNLIFLEYNRKVIYKREQKIGFKPFKIRCNYRYIILENSKSKLGKVMEYYFQRNNVREKKKINQMLFNPFKNICNYRYILVDFGKFEK